MARPSQIILLLEDSLHQQFIFRYLRRLGYGVHAVRIVKSPSGAGSAEQWVREQIAVEVAAYRRRQAATKLIVLIDADTFTVQQRIQQLDQSLQAAGLTKISNATDEVACLVPKRNIETWILCLTGITVDEVTDYKRTRNDWVELVLAAVEKLQIWARPNAAVPAVCVQSLRHGVQELQKLGL